MVFKDNGLAKIRAIEDSTINRWGMQS